MSCPSGPYTLSQADASPWSASSSAAPRHGATARARGDRNLLGAVHRTAPHGQVLLAEPALEQPAGAVEPVQVRDDQSGHDGLTQTPARLDHPLGCSGHRVAGEQHAGHVGVDEFLDHHRHAGPSASPQPVPIRPCACRPTGGVNPPNGVDDSGGAAHPEHGQVRTGEARHAGVLADRAGPDRPQRAVHTGGVQRRHRVGVGVGVGTPPRRRDRRTPRNPPGPAGPPGCPRRVARPCPRTPPGPAPRPTRGSSGAHPRSLTSPVRPSTRTRAPSGIVRVASRVPTMAGIPYSRATIAA